MTTTVKRERVISTGVEFEELFSKFGSYTDPSFRSRVCEIIGKGGCVVVDRLTSENHWNGSITIRFADPPTAKEVLYIVRAAVPAADDFGMDDDKTLWFWWD